MPPPSPNPNIQKITGPTRVGVREAFKDFLKTHLSESSEEEMMQMEKMFVAMLPRRSRGQGGDIVCYACGEKGHRSTECPVKAQRQGARKLTPSGPRDSRPPPPELRYKEPPRIHAAAHLSAGGIDEQDWDSPEEDDKDQYCGMAFRDSSEDESVSAHEETMKADDANGSNSELRAGSRERGIYMHGTRIPGRA